MNSPPRFQPRFLPTLTEVVRPSEVTQEPRASQSDSDTLTQTLLTRVDALVQERVQQELEKLIRVVILERVDAVVAGLQMELHQEVRQLVSDAIDVRNK